jgi:hypothetical protein
MLIKVMVFSVQGLQRLRRQDFLWRTEAQTLSIEAKHLIRITVDHRQVV